MIVGKLTDCARYSGTHKHLAKALNWLLSADLSKITAQGKTEIDGDTIFISASEYTTKDVEQAGWEAHKKYIDIQLITKGNEQIDVASVSSLKEKSPFDAEKDFWCLQGKAEQTVRLVPGQIAVLFPEDAHMPGIHGDRKTPGAVSKLVIKVLA